jgi:hypothetical protein
MQENSVAAGRRQQRVGLALIAVFGLAFLLAVYGSSGSASQVRQAAVSQPQVASSGAAAGNPQPFATAYRPGGQPTPHPTVVIPAAPALPPTTGKLLLDDNFSNTPISNYSIVDLGANPDDPHSTWFVQDSALIQAGDSAGNPGSYETIALTGDASWANYSVEVEAYSGGTPLGLVARYSKAGFYRLRVNRSTVTGAGWRLERYDANKQAYTTLSKGLVGSGYASRQWSYLKLAVQGSQISVTINGAAAANINDSAYQSGRVGVYAEASGARFTNLRVTALQ